MRLNHPVSTVEYAFPPGETLVSTTDTKGRILYCNTSFIRVSGYEKSELLGQPHNLIRHPDMPEEAFRDMWQTIGSGQPWTGLVKNRRKDGSFYWVVANVTPLMQGEQVVGFMSVRTEPSRAQVEQAEALYRTMRSEKQAGVLVHQLSGGQVRAATWSGRVARALSFSSETKLAGLMASFCALSALLPLWAVQGWKGVQSSQTWAMVAVAAVVGGVLGRWVLASMSLRPLETLLKIANRMAAGDLTQDIQPYGSGTLKRLFTALAQLNVNLRSIVQDARSEVNAMRSATREIAAGNQDLSARTESQAANLEQTASSMEQITSTVRNSAGSASQAADLATQASSETAQGVQAMDGVARTMLVIDESSRRIGEIIGVIDSIAFQTNILALNAAVEAARAGEQGRGFAVVASEVRALAGRTTSAAREIKQLISESGEKVAAGTAQAEQAKRTMDAALQTARQVNQVVSGISNGAQEQLLGISQVNEAVTQMDGITQQNAALVEQIAASAVQLDVQASAVAEAVSVFRLDRHATDAPDAVALRKANAKRSTVPA